jgi:hypothetical protein
VGDAAMSARCRSRSLRALAAALAASASACAATASGSGDESPALPALATASAATRGTGLATASTEPARAPSPTASGESPVLRREPEDEDEERQEIPVHGSLLVRYRYRGTGDASDHDVWSVISVDVGDPSEHPFTAHASGRVWADLGGSDPNGVFSGLDDTFGDAHGLLYYAYVDAEQLESLRLLRVGRQQLWRTPVFVVLDGLRVESNEISGVSLGAYGGVRAKYYDRSTPDQVVAGLYGETRPWDGGSVRLDFMYLEDDERLGSGANDLIGLDVRQRLGAELTLESELTLLEREGRDLRLRAHWVDPESDLTLQASYYKLFRTQREQALEVDPYFSALGEYFPFEQVGLLGSKGLGEHTDVYAGVDLRRLDSENQIGEFNHEFDHWFVGTAFSDIGHEGLDLTITGDVFDDDQQDVRTWGAELRHDLDPGAVSLGSYYSLYKYDLFLNSERNDVRTYYAKLRYACTDSMSVDIELDYEDDDFDEYLTLTLGARWRY